MSKSWSEAYGGAAATLKWISTIVACLPTCLLAAPITADISAVKPGPISVSASATSLQVSWTDGAAHLWKVSFSLDTSKPLFSQITADQGIIVENANPIYRCATGKRKGGWDAFFDFPPGDPEGTRRFEQEFHPASATARTVGNRVEVAFDGMQLGIFNGTLRYDFYPGTSLVQQVAVLSTAEPDTAYYYDAGLQMTAEQDVRPGRTMESAIVYYDADGRLQTTTPPYGSERHTVQVHYRALAARMGLGSIAAFPPPHRYFFARDYSTNLGFSWYSSWRGKVSLGVSQQPDDNTGAIYPWMNAPPGTEQEMGLFLLLGEGQPADTLEHVLAYTHRDRFPHLPGYVTFAPHWHFAYTVQAMAKGRDWQPPFKQELVSVGIDAAMIMDFHGDGHPLDLIGTRLHELDEYYKLCRAQSDKNLLLIPSEEADVYLGGHWAVTFPKPVFWYMDRKPNEPFKTTDPVYGTVYRVHTAGEVWKMITEERGYAYETHPRTKGSTGYPDRILNTDYFKSSRYMGTGWKAMPSDLSSPRLGERAFKVVDDLNNLGLHKIMIGEDDLFQIAQSDELYAHMNANYVRLEHMPDFDHYGDLMDAVVRGDGFISTGEIILPSTSISGLDGDSLVVKADISSTFPLRLAEVVWGDGKETHHELIDLGTTSEFDRNSYVWKMLAPHWTWARLAVWDVAGDGAFTNPVWRNR